MNDTTNEVEVLAPDTGSMSALLNRSEIEQQVATAHRFPRSLKRFRDEALEMATLHESIAQACIYSLPRDGKVIEGPSARFAEIIASAWGNCRAAARVVNEGPEFITAQGLFHDLERNVAITFEVQRRITTSKNVRYKPDMIAVTGNAAASIALRNAILKGVPKAFWDPMYQAARKTVMGDFKTLANRRHEAIAAFVPYGVKQDKILAVLGVAGLEDVGLEHLVTLRGILTAIQEGDTTPEQAFADPDIQRPKAKESEAATTAATSTSLPAEAPASSQASDPPMAGRITDGALTILNRHLTQLYPGAFPDAFCRHFEIKTPEHLPMAKLNTAMEWVMEQRKVAGINANV